jgi:hypothetical protein
LEQLVLVLVHDASCACAYARDASSSCVWGKVEQVRALRPVLELVLVLVLVVVAQVLVPVLVAPLQGLALVVLGLVLVISVVVVKLVLGVVVKWLAVAAMLVAVTELRRV